MEFKEIHFRIKILKTFLLFIYIHLIIEIKIVTKIVTFIKIQLLPRESNYFLIRYLEKNVFHYIINVVPHASPFRATRKLQ